MAENGLLNTFQLIRKILWNLLFVISYPIITSFSLIFFGIIWLFSSLSRLLSKISTSKSSVFELKNPIWQSVGIIGNYRIEKLFEDDLLFGPTYYKFKADPPIEAFENALFGDFAYPCFNGILLQRWNSTSLKDLPDFTLTYLDGTFGKLTDIEKIKSFSWKAQKVNEDVVKVKWFNGSEGGEVIVEKFKLNSSQ